MLRKQKWRKYWDLVLSELWFQLCLNKKSEWIKTRRKCIKMLIVILSSLNSCIFSKPFITNIYCFCNQKGNITFVFWTDFLKVILLRNDSGSFNPGLLLSLGSFWQNYQFSWCNPSILPKFYNFYLLSLSLSNSEIFKE